MLEGTHLLTNWGFLEIKLFKINSIIKYKMEKKGPSPAMEPTVKKDKNANPLLHNGVTNKDVSFDELIHLDFQDLALPL